MNMIINPITGRFDQTGSSGGGTSASGQNGLSGTTTLVLGNNVGSTSAVLLSNREIPTGGFNTSWSGTGRVSIGNVVPIGMLHVTTPSFALQSTFERTNGGTIGGLAAGTAQFIYNAEGSSIATLITNGTPGQTGELSVGINFGIKSNTDTLKSLGAITVGVIDYALNKGQLNFSVNGSGATAPGMILSTNNFLRVGNSTAPTSTIHNAGSMAAAITTITGATALTSAHYTVLCNGTFTVSLPNANTCVGRWYNIKNIGVGIITVDSAGGTIDGGATISLPTQFARNTIQSDGNNWFII